MGRVPRYDVDVARPVYVHELQILERRHIEVAEMVPSHSCPRKPGGQVPLQVVNLDLPVPRIRDVHLAAEVAAYCIRSAEPCRCRWADPVPCGAVPDHCPDHAAVDLPDGVVVGVGHVDLASRYHRHVMGGAELGTPAGSVDISCCTSRVSCQQGHPGVGVDLPDLVVPDVCHVDIAGEIAGYASRVVEPGICPGHCHGSVVAPSAGQASPDPGLAAGVDLEDDVVDAVGSEDIARDVSAEACNGSHIEGRKVVRPAEDGPGIGPDIAQLVPDNLVQSHVAVSR